MIGYATIKKPDPSSLPVLIGWNEPGGDIEDANIPGTLGSTYLFPGYTTGGSFDGGDYTYAASKGINFVNISFSWQQLQQTLSSSFNSTYQTQLLTTTEAALAYGWWVMIRPSPVNSSGVYVGWEGKCVGQASGPTNANFADFWSRLTALFKSYPRIIFDLGNEPNTDTTSAQTTALWYSAANAAITAIRSAGGVMPICVEGMGYSGTADWLDGSYYDRNGTGESNGTGWLTLYDPINNLICCPHNYGDGSTGFAGVNKDISVDGTNAANTVFVTNMTLTDNTGSPPTGILHWAQTNTYASGGKIRLFFGETGCSPVPTVGAYATAMSDYYNEIAANLGTIVGLAWWSAGASNGGWYSYDSTNGSGECYCIAPSASYTTDSPAYVAFAPLLPLILA